MRNASRDTRSYLDFYNGYQWDGLARAQREAAHIQLCPHLRPQSRLIPDGQRDQPSRWSAPEAGQEGARRRSARRELLLQACYEHNSLALVDLDTAVDSAVLGDGAFKVTWDTEAGVPSVSPVDPASLVCVRQPDDYRRLVMVQQSYTRRRQESGARGSDSARRCCPASMGGMDKVMEVWTAETLEVWRDGELETRVPNPYGFIPYVVFPNLRVPKEPWGQSDLVDLIGVNRDLNSRLSMLSHILEVSGNPIAVLENVTDSTGIKVGPGQPVGAAQGCKGVPARSPVGRRGGAAHRVHQPAVQGDARHSRDAPHGVRGRGGHSVDRALRWR